MCEIILFDEIHKYLLKKEAFHTNFFYQLKSYNCIFSIFSYFTDFCCTKVDFQVSNLFDIKIRTRFLNKTDFRPQNNKITIKQYCFVFIHQIGLTKKKKLTVKLVNNKSTRAHKRTHINAEKLFHIFCCINISPQYGQGLSPLVTVPRNECHNIWFLYHTQLLWFYLFVCFYYINTLFLTYFSLGGKILYFFSQKNHGVCSLRLPQKSVCLFVFVCVSHCVWPHVRCWRTNFEVMPLIRVFFHCKCFIFFFQIFFHNKVNKVMLKIK